MGNYNIMFKLLSGLALVQANEVEETADEGKYVTHAHYNNVAHTVKKIKLGGRMARLHMCMNHKKQMVPCDHIHIGLKYDVHLVSTIMRHLPRFVHKHLVVYKMYTVLKLYYLHQQELLNQVLSILKEHIHSKELALTLRDYFATLQGKNFGWVSKIEGLLKSHIKMHTNDMERLIEHHKLVHPLHTIIHQAAATNHGKITKMYRMMSKHGYATKSHGAILRTRQHLVHASHRIITKIHHVFKTVHVHKHTHVSTKSFRSTRSSKATTRVLVKKVGVKKAIRVLKRVSLKAKSPVTKKNVKKQVKKLQKKVAKKTAPKKAAKAKK